MLTEQSAIDKIEVLQNGVLQVRRRVAILRDGVEIAFSFDRCTVEPGSDLTGIDERVAAVASAVWTPELIDAYHALLDGPAQA